MKKKDIEMLIIAKDAKENERCRCLKAVDDEPEFPGDMPDKVATAVRSGDPGDVVRLAVSLTKRGIRDRILAGS